MWTATLNQIDVDANTQRSSAVILFSDGIKYKFLETFDLNGLSSSTFRSRVEARRKQLEDSYAFIDGVNIKTFSLTPDAALVQTQAELDKAQFFSDYGKLQQMQTLINVGVFSGAEPEYVNLKSKVKAEYKPEYFI